jgi:histidinol-phosphate aminotransferase
MSFCDIALQSVTQLQPYVPGKPIAELERQYGVKDIVKLASNENPLGPSPKVLLAVEEASKELSLYPDGNGFTLKTALADKYSVDLTQITLGNGSNDVLEMIARTFVTPDDEVLFSQYTFAVYPIVTQAIGAKAVIAPAKDYGHDLAAMQARITERTKVIFIANPNNPTGTYLPADELEKFISAVPLTAIVVLDEAYVEYGDSEIDSIRWLTQYPNLVITRTFSKAYGLAGLRIGFSLSNPEIADLMNRVRQPFNANNIALAAATVALNDDEYLVTSKQVNDEGMKQLIEAFERLNLTYIPSKANFLTVDVQQDGNAIFDDLLHKGVIVRPLVGYGLPTHLRISIGLKKENQRFIEALTEVLGRS